MKHVATRVFYSTTYFLDWIDVAQEMRRREKWEPCYWITYPGIEERVAEAFPNAIRHPYLNAIRGIPPLPLSRSTYVAIDEPTLDRFRSCESTALAMMDRLDVEGSFTYPERIRHYHRLLSYWLWMVETIRPEIAVFSATPHLVADYIAYEVMRSRGVPTLVFGETSLPLSVYIRTDAHGDIVGLPAAYRCCLDGATSSSESLDHDWLSLVEASDKISSETKSYLAKIRQDYEQAQPEYMRRQLRPSAVAQPSRRPLHRRFVNVLKIWRWPLYVRNLSLARARRKEHERRRQIEDGQRHGYDFLKLPGVAIEKCWMTTGEIMRVRERGHSKKEHLKRAYEDSAEQVDLSQKYVYVPLHYQPERTTSSEGGDYTHQLLMVALLHDSLPDDWLLYVREHPSQFVPSLYGEQGRVLNFYDDLREYPRVRLVSHQDSTFDLIDSSQAVATVTGTAGWEALLRGKPVMVFGSAWYRLCEGVYTVKSAGDARDAYESISRGRRLSGRRIYCFIEAISEVARRASTNQMDERDRPSALTLSENVEALCGLLSSASEASAAADEWMGGSSAEA